MAKLRQDASEPIDDDTALLLVARTVLEGPSDAGRASHQVLLHVCPRCGAGRQEAHGDLVDVSEPAVAMARCDAQVIVANEAIEAIGANERGGNPADAHVGISPRATQTIPPAVRRLVLRRDAGHCRVPGCRHASLRLSWMCTTSIRAPTAAITIRKIS